MKVETLNSIKIQGRPGQNRFFARLTKGDRISADIIRRIDAKNAVIEIGGKRIIAEFKNGIPGEASIILTLEDASKGSYIFKLFTEAFVDSIVRDLQSFALFDMAAIKKSLSSLITQFLALSTKNIFDFNELLLIFSGKSSEKENRISLLLSRLISRGMSGDCAMLLSFLLTDPSAEYSFILPLLFRLRHFKKFREKNTGHKGNIIINGVNDILDEVDTYIEESNDREVLAELIDLLRGQGSQGGAAHYSEFILFDEEDIDAVPRPLRCIRNNNSLALSVEFSYLGRIDIIARKVSTGIDMSLFPQKEETRVWLSESRGLAEMFEKMDFNIQIHIYNKQFLIDKILDINSHLNLNSQFDVTV